MSSLEVALERVADADDDAWVVAQDTSSERRLSGDPGHAPLVVAKRVHRLQAEIIEVAPERGERGKEVRADPGAKYLSGL